MRTKIKELLFNKDTKELIDQKVMICGWIRSTRNQKTFSFIELNDGSCLANIQVILEHTHKNYESITSQLTTGTSISVKGLIKESPGKNQSIEILAEDISIFGLCDAAKYPLQKKRHSFEFLRTIAHLRPRTNTQGAVIRVRNALAFATHLFFQQKGFVYVNTPIITGSDCEGGGELFQVTTLPLGAKDESKDFFGKRAYLTVSGQLNGEALACAMGDIYTFGPTFRAENSHTSRHLAEFWMIEPEMAFTDLQGVKKCAEEYIKFAIDYAFKHCSEDLKFFNEFIEKGVIERLEKVLHSKFANVTYTDAIEILKKSGKNFEFPVDWGIDLQSEHERYLAEEHFNSPVIITDYPKQIKAFYMRQNDDQKTVAAMDIIVPKIGELVGGSQREERLEVLEKKIIELQLNRDDYQWFLELREYGSVPHGGFGLGFERLVQFVTGMENIRDVIPFPRYPGHAEF